jgi:FlaA1/EpsC-like NDP-sugar epimerase
MNTKRILLTGGTGGLGHDVTSAILAHYSEVTTIIPYQDENRVRRISSCTKLNTQVRVGKRLSCKRQEGKYSV